MMGHHWWWFCWILWSSSVLACRKAFDARRRRLDATFTKEGQGSGHLPLLFHNYSFQYCAQSWLTKTQTTYLKLTQKPITSVEILNIQADALDLTEKRVKTEGDGSPSSPPSPPRSSPPPSPSQRVELNGEPNEWTVEQVLLYIQTILPPSHFCCCSK